MKLFANRIFVLTAAIMLSTLVANAQKRLRHPLVFVEADSVRILDNYWATAVQPLNANDGAATPRLDVRLSKEDRKRFKKELRLWNEDLSKTINIVGGRGNELEDPQALDAVSNLSMASRLLLQTGDSRFADLIETASHNALMTTAQKRTNTLETEISKNAMAAASGMAYMKGKKDISIYVNLYFNSFATVDFNGQCFAIDQITSMPYDGRVKIRVSTPQRKRVRLRLCLRIPGWMSEEEQAKLKIHVNGREEDLPRENGYAIIDRLWNSHDEVFFDLPLVPHANMSKDSSKVAMTCGPIVYAFVDNSASSLDQPVYAPSDSLEFGQYKDTAVPAVNLKHRSPQGLETFSAIPYPFIPANGMKSSKVWIDGQKHANLP